jgi:tetraacyldisaccharide 4'-kinase
MIKHFNFPDHHYYSKNDINKIINCYQNNSSVDVSILLTEKDKMRISNTEIQDILIDYPVFFQPITYKFAQNGSDFDEHIRKVLVNIEG